jgi:hypothetical protein
MDRVCIYKTTGNLIEMQSGGTIDRLPKTDTVTDEEYSQYLANCDKLEAARLDTLRQNAINAGYAEDEIEVKWVTDEEWVAIEEANKPIPTYKELRAKEYPDYREYLDGIVKGDQAQIDKYIADCLAVKAKYPKS